MQEKNSIPNLLAKALSIVLHPVFVPTLVFAFFVIASPSLFFGLTPKNVNMWLISIAYITITFPLLVVFLMWRLKFIETIHMNEPKERYGPLIASMLFYFWVFWLFHKQFDAHLLIQGFLLGVFFTTVLVFMASIFFKISMHSAAWGSVATFAIIYSFQGKEHFLPFLIASILIAGLVGSIRLFLQAHTLRQVIAGYIAGIIAQVLALGVVHIIPK